MKNTIVLCDFRNPLAQMEDEEYFIVLCVFQEPSCPDGGGEARARTEDEEYFIVLCVSGTPLPRWRRRRESTYRR